MEAQEQTQSIGWAEPQGVRLTDKAQRMRLGSLAVPRLRLSLIISLSLSCFLAPSGLSS